MGARSLGHTLSPSSSGLTCWLGPSRAAAPGRLPGGGAYPPESPAPPGLDHAATPPPPPQPRLLRPLRPLGPGAATSFAQPPAPWPMGAWGPGPLPAPPRSQNVQKPHSARPGLRCAPASGPTRRVCLGSANGAIVPPPDPEAQPSSGDSRVPGKWDGVVVVRKAQL